MSRSSRRTIRRLLFISTLLLTLCRFQSEGLGRAGGDYDVRNYDVALQLDMATHEISGRVIVDFASLADNLETVRLAASGLRVTSIVGASSETLAFEQSGDDLAVRLPRALARGQRSELRVEYTGRPTRGLRVGEEQAFTFFHTSSWLVCNDDPADKSTLTLALTLPAEMRVVASGRAKETELVAGGLAQHRFELDRPYSTYLYGFAAGRWSEVREPADGVLLQHFGVGFTEAELKQIFATTSEMLSFFSQRSGIPYPLDSYSQVLLPGAPPQELAGMSLMSTAYGRSMLADPREDYLIAHELAHQWWGNLVTCLSWSDFWLNEGIATFMVAAFKEHRWGTDDYDRERILARQRYNRALRDGNNRPLVYNGWSRPEDMSGPLTYSRGLLVLHLLRQELGDRPFWDGIARYTKAGAGSSVTSADLQRAMEAAARRTLDWFFRQFVYSADMPRVTATHRRGPDGMDILLRQEADKPWRLSFDIAVQTDFERVQRRVTFTRRSQTFRIKARGRPLSVCVDCAGTLPLAVGHARPLSMLLWQIGSERSLAARAEALLTLDAACGHSTEAADATCGDLERIYMQLRATTPDRLIAQLAGQLLQDRPKPAQ